MCQECQEIEVGYSESSEAWDQTAEYGSEEKVLNSGIKEEVSGKVCTKCGEWKPLGEFGFDKRKKDGHVSRCRACVRDYYRKTTSESVSVGVFVPSGYKLCKKCDEIKLLSDFGPRKGTKDGHEYACRVCQALYDKLKRSGDFVSSRKPKKEVEVGEGMKYCNKCGEVKPFSAFSKSKKRKDGYSSDCRACINLVARLWRAENTKVIKNKEIVPEGMRKCPKCGEVKLLLDFYTSSTTKNGLDCYCKLCEKLYQNDWAMRRKEKLDDLPRFVTRVCSCCAEEKDISCFSKQVRGKGGFNSICKMCSNKKGRLRNEKLNFSPKSDVIKRCVRCGLSGGISDFSKSKRNVDGLKGYCKKCQNELMVLYFKNNPEALIRQRLRRRLGFFVRRGDLISKDAAIEFLGCTVFEFMQYIETLFYRDEKTGREMSWENYGRPKGEERGWDFDHIIPLSRVVLKDPEQQRRVCHYTNIRPLWSWENNKKSNKLLSEMKAA